MAMKKSQIKMVETISILVIFFVILLFGFVFYSQFQKRAILVEQQELVAKRAVVNSLKTTFLNEFRCDSTEPSGTCVDTIRWDEFANKLKEPDIAAYYSNIFSRAHIYYTDVITGEQKELYDGSVANYSVTSVQTPVLLRNVEHRAGSAYITWDSFGVLHVDYYYK